MKRSKDSAPEMVTLVRNGLTAYVMVGPGIRPYHGPGAGNGRYGAALENVYFAYLPRYSHAVVRALSRLHR